MKGDLAHFDIPADDADRLAAFYSDVLGWEVAPPMSDYNDYRLIKTSDREGAVAGGMGPKGTPDQAPMNFYEVDSLEETAAKVASSGGTVIMERMPVPKFGYMAVCIDPEGNSFGLWVEDANASA
jgi:hypothetical protein